MGKVAVNCFRSLVQKQIFENSYVNVLDCYCIGEISLSSQDNASHNSELKTFVKALLFSLNVNIKSE